MVLRWRRFAWLHLPAAAWGSLVVVMGWRCPLTPLENALRRLAGLEGYSGGFIEHYLAAAIYPAGLTRPMHVALGVALLLVNAAVYWRVIRSG